MKTCPTCKRTYSDPSITFCLADGALMSAPYPSLVGESSKVEPPPTLRIESAPDGNGASPATGRIQPTTEAPVAKSRRWQIQVAATSFFALFAIVGLALYGLPFYYDYMVRDFGWTRAQVTSGNA